MSGSVSLHSPPTPSLSLKNRKNNHHVVIEEEAGARGGSTGSKGKESVFLPPFTPVGNCGTAPGLSPRL